MKTSEINNILNSQPILIKFALKLFVCKCLSFQTHLFLDLRFPFICVCCDIRFLKYIFTFICQKTLNGVCFMLYPI